jgi:polysaccharide export outer membrane protein
MLLLAACLLLCVRAGAQPAPAPAPAPAAAGNSRESHRDGTGVTDPGYSPAKDGDKAREYHLFPRDMLKITILDEPDLSVDRRVDGLGRVTLPLVGIVDLKNLRITEAEEKVRQLYIAKEILIHPQVAITVSEYSPREISVLGQVGKPGNVPLPIESDSISIVDAISQAGGFTRISLTDGVQVTRHPADGGADQSITVNVAKMIDGHSAAPFTVVPGDVIFVPERIF